MTYDAAGDPETWVWFDGWEPPGFQRSATACTYDDAHQLLVTEADYAEDGTVERRGSFTWQDARIVAETREDYGKLWYTRTRDYDADGQLTRRHLEYASGTDGFSLATLGSTTTRRRRPTSPEWCWPWPIWWYAPSGSRSEGLRSLGWFGVWAIHQFGVLVSRIAQEALMPLVGANVLAVLLAGSRLSPGGWGLVLVVGGTASAVPAGSILGWSDDATRPVWSPLSAARTASVRRRCHHA